MCLYLARAALRLQKSEVFWFISLQRPSVYFLIDVQVTAPVLLVPLTRDAEQSIMVDLGHLEIKNGLETTDIQGESVTVDAYALRLQSFKISRYFNFLSDHLIMICSLTISVDYKMNVDY